MARPYPVAASAAVELALVGPPRQAAVVAATAQAAYLTVDDEHQTMISLVTPTAVRVPCALVLDGKVPAHLPAPGMIATVGNGLVAVDGAVFRVARWWRPPRPRGLGAVAPATLANAVRWLTGSVADPLDPAGRAAVADLVQALATGEPVEPPTRRLLGRGPGLTPTGDDVLAGALVGLSALGSPVAATLGDAVIAAAPDATTTVSVALLRHAVRGECIPQLADLLDAIARDVSGLPRAAGGLLAVGHCSGAGLLHGVLVALAIAHDRLAVGVLSAGAATRAAAAAALSAVTAATAAAAA
jgi:hypothetical protein